MFTFNGISAATMGINVNRANISAIPPIRNNFEVVDGMDGVLDFGLNYDGKYIQFECNFEPLTNYETALDFIDTLNNYLNPKQGLQDLILDDQADRKYRARLVEQLDIKRILYSGGTFNLTFFCPDSYAESLTETVLTYTTSGIKNFTLLGNATCFPKINLICDIPENETEKLTLNFNNKHVILFKEELDTLYKLELDCKEIKADYIELATPSNSVNGLEKIHTLSFPELQVGANTLEILFQSPITLTSVEVRYYARWL